MKKAAQINNIGRRHQQRGEFASFPDLEQQDIQACLIYDARRVNLERLAA